jgi:hypothetical protein
MELRKYFETVKGTGILGTSDAGGNVNMAVYGRPHFMEDGTVAFIMQERLSHANLQSNPRAAYLFVEEGAKREGKRLTLEKVREEDDPEAIAKVRRPHPVREADGEAAKKRFLVFFKVTGERPLVGS